MITKGKIYLSVADIIELIREFEVPKPKSDTKLELVEINKEQFLVLDVEEEYPLS